MTGDGRDLGYAYHADKAGRVTILHRGKHAATLRGERASGFLRAAEECSFDAQQQLMARATGHYRHGNERTAKNHPRNRRY